MIEINPCAATPVPGLVHVNAKCECFCGGPRPTYISKEDMTMNVSERYQRLSDREKLGLGLLALFFGNKALNGVGKAIFFVVWLVVVIGFIGFCLLMAYLTGGFA